MNMSAVYRIGDKNCRKHKKEQEEVKVRKANGSCKDEMIRQLIRSFQGK